MHYENANWRLIVHHPLPGSLNMAVDEAISIHVAEGQSLPTLRFYGWEPACLSLGYGQSVNDVDRDGLAQHGWEVVRRQTGGRAILHTDELTYSITGRPDDPRFSGGVVESYRKLSEGIQAGLHVLGAQIESEKAGSGGHRFKGAVCFEVPSDYEITAWGKKLVGSAQTRRKDIVLQHGTLPLIGDISRICDALYFENEDERLQARKRVMERATTLQKALGEVILFEQAADALIQGFSEVLNLTLQPEDLSYSEWEMSQELAEKKYRSIEWTCKVM